MAKIKKEKGKQNSKGNKMLDLETYEDYNSEKPLAGDPNLKMTGLQNKGAIKMYTCSMHPEVIAEKPGECPKCGMKLIEKT